ncbi:36144_t:CDS:2, partial [Racocetra persica]
VLVTLSGLYDNLPTYQEAVHSAQNASQTQSEALRIQEQKNVNYLRERLTDKFSVYEKRSKP